MFRWAFTFLVAALVVAPFAFGAVRPEVAAIGQGVFALFAALAVVTGAISYDRRRREGD